MRSLSMSDTLLGAQNDRNLPWLRDKRQVLACSIMHPLRVDDLRIDTADADHAATTTAAAGKIMGPIDVRGPRLETDIHCLCGGAS
jgi:hypothetical protein